MTSIFSAIFVPVVFFHNSPVKHIESNKNKKDGYRQLNVRQLGSLRPCDHRGKCYMDRKRIQCLSNAYSMYPSVFNHF